MGVVLSKGGYSLFHPPGVDRWCYLRVRRSNAWAEVAGNQRTETRTILRGQIAQLHGLMGSKLNVGKWYLVVERTRNRWLRLQVAGVQVSSTGSGSTSVENRLRE